ncbi:hypothetical protein [Hymenobacter terrenus]|uniref:hypothetical protein n=1 Tax=Hymenobacter terrenus TaxID=1629124 RepID=UPI000AD53E09|nr:hypothetical protein [Hymenobacter terrenus]
MLSLGLLTAGIPRIARPNTAGSTSSIHNKFVIIDANDPNPKVPCPTSGRAQ